MAKIRCFEDLPFTANTKLTDIKKILYKKASKTKNIFTASEFIDLKVDLEQFNLEFLNFNLGAIKVFELRSIEELEDHFMNRRFLVIRCSDLIYNYFNSLQISNRRIMTIYNAINARSVRVDKELVRRRMLLKAKREFDVLVFMAFCAASEMTHEIMGIMMNEIRYN